jgi:hypothetical protein
MTAFVSNKIARPLTIVWWIAVALGVVVAILGSRDWLSVLN